MTAAGTSAGTEHAPEAAHPGAAPWREHDHVVATPVPPRPDGGVAEHDLRSASDWGPLQFAVREKTMNRVSGRPEPNAAFGPLNWRAADSAATGRN